MREDKAGSFLILGLDEKDDRAREQNGDMEDNISFHILLHPVHGHSVHKTIEYRQIRHDADGEASSRLISKVQSHGDNSEQNLCRTVSRSCDTSRLAKQVEPAIHPSDGRDPVHRGKSRNSVLQSTTSRIG